ncbi:spore germination protein [Paenibacillus favisporus]|uniref:spore germination protein n=1 Tax=Paenibacillus favisporus TaxID=221028 RepID=UPI002DBAAB9B|nr:spore germination protein [Paenibacillus favisporus]MEC0173470.1 spore germination protein [Paenibacillus favisporus]
MVGKKKSRNASTQQQPSNRAGKNGSPYQQESVGTDPAELHPDRLYRDLKSNLDRLNQDMGGSNDLVIRKIVARNLGRKVAFVYIDGLVDTSSVSEFAIETVLNEIKQFASEAELNEAWELEQDVKEGIEGEDPEKGKFSEDINEDKPGAASEEDERFLRLFKEKALAVGEIYEISEWSKLYIHLMSGDTILFIDRIGIAVIASTKGGERRSVSEPESQTVIRGPREGFTESIRTNTALLRRKIKSPNLWLEEMQLGRVTQTDVGIMYIHGIVDEKNVDEVRKRLSVIDIDGILESGYIEELIENTNKTIFPTVYHSERPDVIAANLLEGRIAILVDGTPFALLLPSTFNMFFQAAEDYYNRFDVGSLIRFLRYFSFLIGLLLPSFYVAIIGFHQEMIPTSWLLKLAVQREGVPFPAFVEAFIMETVFEILREAGVRMPRSVGNTISIVGGLVLGQAAVEAGIVSPVVVIVVSLTAIASFVSPAYNIGIAARMLRFAMLIAASMFGIYGIACMLLILVLHLCSLKSLNVPYMAPYAPMIYSDMKDSMLRMPQDYMKKRPKLISRNNPVRFREGAMGNQQADRDENEPHQTQDPSEV